MKYNREPRNSITIVSYNFFFLLQSHQKNSMGEERFSTDDSGTFGYPYWVGQGEERTSTP